MTLNSNSNNYLNRYTTLPILLDILSRKQLTLLDPQSWEDRNDSYCIDQFKKHGRYKTVLGLCFSAARETFHHWKVFSGGVSGVCIEFNKNKLLKTLPKEKGFRQGEIEYMTIENLESASLEFERIPFLKRWAYRDEKEYRIIYQHTTEELQTKGFSVECNSIRRITLSPWLPRAVTDTVSAVIQSLPGCKEIEIKRSTLIENSRWKKAILNGCQTSNIRT
jgi:hypothetical protein